MSEPVQDPRSPVEDVYAALRVLNAGWDVAIGVPDGPGWIAGTDLHDASAGPFRELLERIGARAKTGDRRTIAASFALRYGWASAMAIAPYLRHRCVPDIALDNVSFKFKESTFFERTAIHEARGAVVVGDPRGRHALMSTVADDAALVRLLREHLVAQAAPVVVALFRWSGFSPLGTWGMLTSSWAAQFTGLAECWEDQRTVWPEVDALFAGNDVVARMRPRMHAVTCEGVTHLYQRRASCCRYYLLPQGDLCASCPLVSDDDRMARNIEWMRTQIERRRSPAQPAAGHG